MKCLILAAGRGSRLQQQADSKPLAPLLGVPLIERTIRNCIEAGVDGFVVVTGHAGERLTSFLRTLGGQLGVPVETVSNPDWASSENGRSVLAADGLINEPFLLSMADHLFEPGLIRKLMTADVPEGGLTLAVDGSLGNPLVDEADVTRVRRHGNHIEAIEKGLSVYDGYDTGLFLCTPSIFTAVRESILRGDSTLSGAVRLLAGQGKVQALPVDGSFWIDVDDQPAMDRAESALLERLRSKNNDGPVARWLNRPLSIQLSRWLVRFQITPNQISLSSFILSVAGTGLFMQGGYTGLVLGGLLAQIASVIDGCDGEVARLTYQGSDFGGWFDAVLDRYSDALLLFGLTWHLLIDDFSGTVLATGFLAIIGSFMLSYSADKYDGLMRSRATDSRFRLGRDVRVFLILLGALFNQVFATLLIIALVMNLETVRRVWVCRHG